MIEETAQRAIAASYDPPAAPACAASCLNCGAPLSSAFCQDCGQRVLPPHPTMRELAGDAFSELSGWDGKFIETFRLLLRKPGELTRRFIEGQRLRYISPVRLYLTLSLVYFVTASAAPVLAPMDLAFSAGGVNVSATDKPSSRPERAAKAVLGAQNQILTPAERDSAIKDIATAPWYLRPILKRLIEDPGGMKRGMYETLPRAMFLLVPLFAAIVGLFYRKRHYPEHLYFALHLHAFAFLVLMLSELSKFTHVFALSAVVGFIVQLSLPVYAVLALKRVYGGSTGKAILKGAGISLMYFIVYGVTVAGVVYLAAVSS